MIDVEETADITIPDGWFIEIHEPAIIELVKNEKVLIINNWIVLLRKELRKVIDCTLYQQHLAVAPGLVEEIEYKQLWYLKK